MAELKAESPGSSKENQVEKSDKKMDKCNGGEKVASNAVQNGNHGEKSKLSDSQLQQPPPTQQKNLLDVHKNNHVEQKIKEKSKSESRHSHESSSKDKKRRDEHESSSSSRNHKKKKSKDKDRDKEREKDKKKNVSSSTTKPTSKDKEEITTKSTPSSNGKVDGSSKTTTQNNSSNASKEQPSSTKPEKASSSSSLAAPMLKQHKIHKVQEPSKKPESTFIKVDYMKNVKTDRIDKSKETVTRILDFSCNGNGAKAQAVEKQVKCSDEKKNGSVSKAPADANGLEKTKVANEKQQVEVKKEPEEVKDIATVVFEKPKSPVREEKSQLTNGSALVTAAEIKSEKEKNPCENGDKSEKKSSSKHSSSSSKSHHHSSSSSSHRHSSSSSSHHKSSSHRSSKECSRCYRRSKIKKANVGVQTRHEVKIEKKLPTRELEFEPSHRVGNNRQPVKIKTNMKYLKYGRFYHIEIHTNGGASIVHMYQDELDTLSKEELNELVDEFFELVFSEDEDGWAYHVMGVVHDAARYLPDMLEHLAENYSSLTVKSGVIGRNNDIETCTMGQYYEQVNKHYDEGTIRHGPLHQISLVGTVHEESGGYLPRILEKLEASPFLKKAMPWGKLSIVQMDPRLSNDGPILWMRPGEQLIPTADMKTPSKRQRSRINELRNLQYLPRASESREIMFEDRTKAHADHVGMGHERQTTAAVGILKAVHCGRPYTQNRVTKDVVAFAAQSFTLLTEKLQLDLHEPPISQCIQWIEEAKLNQLKREGVKYAKVPLYDNDIYFLPRNIIHQFRTVTAVTSLAWHLRHRNYYPNEEEIEEISNNYDVETPLYKERQTLLPHSIYDMEKEREKKTPVKRTHDGKIKVKAESERKYENPDLKMSRRMSSDDVTSLMSNGSSSSQTPHKSSKQPRQEKSVEKKRKSVKKENLITPTMASIESYNINRIEEKSMNQKRVENDEIVPSKPSTSQSVNASTIECIPMVDDDIPVVAEEIVVEETVIADHNVIESVEPSPDQSPDFHISIQSTPHYSEEIVTETIVNFPNCSQTAP